MNGAPAEAGSGNRPPADRPVERACCCIALLMLVGTFAIRFSLFQTRCLNPDEFEHLHAAWCQSEGLAGMPMFLDKSLEIRPDVPAVLLWACALAFLARGIRAYEKGEVPGLAFVMSGLCLGGASMCTQKLLFAVPGFVVGGLAWVVFGGAADERASGLYHRYTITPLVFF